MSARSNNTVTSYVSDTPAPAPAAARVGRRKTKAPQSDFAKFAPATTHKSGKVGFGPATTQAARTVYAIQYTVPDTPDVQIVSATAPPFDEAGFGARGLGSRLKYKPVDRSRPFRGADTALQFDSSHERAGTPRTNPTSPNLVRLVHVVAAEFCRAFGAITINGAAGLARHAGPNPTKSGLCAVFDWPGPAEHDTLVRVLAALDRGEMGEADLTPAVFRFAAKYAVARVQAAFGAVRVTADTPLSVVLLCMECMPDRLPVDGARAPAFNPAVVRGALDWYARQTPAGFPGFAHPAVLKFLRVVLSPREMGAAFNTKYRHFVAAINPTSTDLCAPNPGALFYQTEFAALGLKYDHGLIRFACWCATLQRNDTNQLELGFLASTDLAADKPGLNIFIKNIVIYTARTCQLATTAASSSHMAFYVDEGRFVYV